MIICSCYKIEEKDILDIIDTLDKDNFIEDIMKKTCAGIGCRNCISPQFDLKNKKVRYLVDIMEEYSKKEK